MNDMTRLVAALVAAIVLLAAGVFCIKQSQAKEGYDLNGRPLVCAPAEYEGDAVGLQVCKDWISGVLQPHSKTRCCGEGDAFIADEWEQGPDGGWVAIITEDYPSIPVDDGEGGSFQSLGVPKGTRIPIDPQRMDDEHQGNPTGHGVVFLSITGNGKMNVLCFFTKTLI
jgi:hypothetical protein